MVLHGFANLCCSEILQEDLNHIIDNTLFPAMFFHVQLGDAEKVLL